MHAYLNDSVEEGVSLEHDGGILDAIDSDEVWIFFRASQSFLHYRVWTLYAVLKFEFCEAHSILC